MQTYHNLSIITTTDQACYTSFETQDVCWGTKKQQWPVGKLGTGSPQSVAFRTQKANFQHLFDAKENIHSASKDNCDGNSYSSIGQKSSFWLATFTLLRSLFYHDRLLAYGNRLSSSTFTSSAKQMDEAV